ncbi:murein L,D-transpeptidase [Belliella marina]|uniref:Murein L,D-transpeptidase n=1 Tax=Belliella marina TaxID=1644146 RepID=A0ABW4VXR7_9BACT
MRKNRFTFFLLILLGFQTGGLKAQNSQVEISNLIRSLIEKDSPESDQRVAGQHLFSAVVIKEFYSDRLFMPTWSEGGVLPEIAYEMRYEIQQVQFDGLNPMDYHLSAVNALFDKYEKSKKAIETFELFDYAALDVLLSDAYMIISTHLYLGKVNPGNLKSQWNIHRSAPEINIGERLVHAIENQSIRKSFESLYPTFTIYKKMRDGLRFMYDHEKKFNAKYIGSWKKLKIDKSIKLGDSNNQINEIKSRLVFWGFLDPNSLSEDKVYDSIMEPGIKKLQKRHGLEPDGIIGQGTVFALNQSPSDLIATAKVNMERLRWLPSDLKEQELILVNTANFQLDFISKRDTLLSSKVIVGKSYHATPQFNADMSYIVFSPNWTVPVSITRSEIIPAIKKNPNYLASKNMSVINNSGEQVDPGSIDWQKVNPRKFPYTIRQGPGAQNSLGLVKFMFPNRYSVYIHDTPSRSLFAREDRALSHGCIRLENPAELAKLLLSFDAQWTEGKIAESMRLKKEKVVNLDRKIPVVIFYLTYWTDSVGNEFYRQDIYNRDNEILKALGEERKS